MGGGNSSRRYNIEPETDLKVDGNCCNGGEMVPKNSDDALKAARDGEEVIIKVNNMYLKFQLVPERESLHFLTLIPHYDSTNAPADLQFLVTKDLDGTKVTARIIACRGGKEYYLCVDKNSHKVSFRRKRGRIDFTDKNVESDCVMNGTTNGSCGSNHVIGETANGNGGSNHVRDETTNGGVDLHDNSSFPGSRPASAVEEVDGRPAPSLPLRTVHAEDGLRGPPPTQEGSESGLDSTDSAHDESSVWLVIPDHGDHFVLKPLLDTGRRLAEHDGNLRLIKNEDDAGNEDSVEFFIP